MYKHLQYLHSHPPPTPTQQRGLLAGVAPNAGNDEGVDGVDPNAGNDENATSNSGSDDDGANPNPSSKHSSTSKSSPHTPISAVDILLTLLLNFAFDLKLRLLQLTLRSFLDLLAFFVSDLDTDLTSDVTSDTVSIFSGLLRVHSSSLFSGDGVKLGADLRRSFSFFFFLSFLASARRISDSPSDLERDDVRLMSLMSLPLLDRCRFIALSVSAINSFPAHRTNDRGIVSIASFEFTLCSVGSDSVLVFVCGVHTGAPWP